MAVGHAGSSAPLQRLLFPNGFVGEVMALLLQGWQELHLPSEVTRETPITALFRDVLLQCQNEDAGWFFTLEDPDTDPTFGTELGRNDIRIYPPRHKRQTIFLTVECKRLNVPRGSLAAEYVNEGMMRFVTNRYSKNLTSGVMVGYVMDSDTAKAFGAVRREIGQQKAALRIPAGRTVTVPSRLTSHYPDSADSVHSRSDGEFALHHLLLPVVRSK
jgi:hypothetical protein